MAVTTVTPGDIAAELGRTAPDQESAQWAQWDRWIERAESTIARRAVRCGKTIESLDRDAVDEVVVYVVIGLVGRPVDGATSVSEQVSVDDGSVNESRQYARGYGDVLVRDEWWEILGLCRRRGAFTVQSRWRPGFAR